MAFRTAYAYIPPVDGGDSVMAELAATTLLEVAEAVVDEVDVQAGNLRRRRAMLENAYAEAGELQAYAGTTWPLSHLWEFGSANTPAEAWWSNAAEAVASEVGRYESP
ncbi:MAG: hypothetical protein ACF8PN_04940 [Phycisphaerales bacterium]